MDLFDVPFLHKRSKNSHLNCSTRMQPINKLKIKANKYILKLSDEPKKARSGPELVGKLIKFDSLLLLN